MRSGRLPCLQKHTRSGRLPCLHKIMKKFRKHLRLKNYDYSQEGLYYVTVCVNFKEKILWQKSDDKEVVLSPVGKIVDDCINYISENYENVVIDKYCIMPNHIHMIVDIGMSESRRGSLPLREMQNQNNIELGKIIGRMKSYTTKQYRELPGKQNAILWQRNFYEHIIRNDEDYAEKWQYIDENALKWNLEFDY